MKFAYDRYIRPNNIVPTDPKQRTSVDNLVQEDCPEDSFEPLKAKHKSKSSVQLVPGVPSTNNVEFEIERIIRGLHKDTVLQYLVKWRHFPKSYNSWEPVDNLNATIPWNIFLRKNPVRITGKIT